MLDLDLLALRNPERFQQMCLRLARYEYPTTYALAYGAHDGGRDGVALLDPRKKRARVVVFQSKFVPHPSRAKRKIVESLDALKDAPHPIALWILCLPVDPTGVFMDWLTVEARKRGRRFAVWGRTELLRRLEVHRDVIDVFFHGVHAELSRYFRSASLELFQIKLDPACEWTQPDPGVLGFASKDVHSPDLVLDLVVRNTGPVATAITSVAAEVFDWRIKLHGLPGDGLLFPQVEYRISIRGGEPGHHRADCEPPLAIAGGGIARLKVVVADTGYSWNGGLRITLHAGPRETLALPAMRLWT